MRWWGSREQEKQVSAAGGRPGVTSCSYLIPPVLPLAVLGFILCKAGIENAYKMAMKKQSGICAVPRALRVV